jgi:pimeloyl-ACP methyl ester carboxylesterase
VRSRFRIAGAEREAASPEAIFFAHDVVGVPWAEVEQLRALPTWATRVAGVDAIPRGMRAFGRFQFDPERLRALHVPTLLLVGGESTLYHKATTATIANALPNARVVELPGQQHNANFTAPELLATEILRFLQAEGVGAPS